MKKLLLSFGVLAAVFGTSAANYTIGDFITPTTQLSSGEHKVILEVITQTQKGYLHTLNASGDNIYFGAKATDKYSGSEFGEDFVYTINVDNEGKFTIKNSTGAYCPIPTQSSTSVYMYSNVTDVANAGILKIKPRPTITNSYTEHYMLELTNSTLNHVELHLDGNGSNPVVCFYSTGDVGIKDAGGSGRTACAIKMYEAVEVSDPLTSGSYFRMLNREGDGGLTRAHSYLGYYPTSGETSWYIYDKGDGTRTNAGKSDFITCGNFANARTGADQAQVDGQLWRLVEGEEGKYALVNKAYPNGAVSKEVFDNNGNASTNATNPSRWKYLADRNTDVDKVCWFTLEPVTADGATFYRFIFNNANNEEYKYLALSASPQKYQTIRLNSASEAGVQWLLNDEAFDPEAAIEPEIESMRQTALGFETMKAVINNQTVSKFYAWASRENLGDRIAAGNTHYQNYINNFNHKYVTLKNLGRTASPYLTVLTAANGTVEVNSLAASNDDSVWKIAISGSKAEFRNRTAVKSIHSEAVTPVAGEGGVMFKISNGQYLQLAAGQSALSTNANASNNTTWEVKPATYTFTVPQVSTGENPTYYRIISDRWLSRIFNNNEIKNSNLSVAGENRQESGAGEVVSAGRLGDPGIFWRLEAGSAEGSVKFINLVDGYQLGKVSDSNKKLAMSDGNGLEYYLKKLEGLHCGQNDNSAIFSINNSYAISSNNSDIAYDNRVCIDANSGNPLDATNSNFSPINESRNNLGDNGSVWYFIEATDADIEAAKASYVAAVKQRINYKEVVDDTENLIALSNEKAVETYSALVTSQPVLNNTIDEVNHAKRNNTYTNKHAEIVAEVNNILDNYVLNQHVQLSAQYNNRQYFMKDNGTAANLKGIEDDTHLATVWTVTKNENGSYKLTNGHTEKCLGDINATYKTVEPANAQDYELIYNPTYAGFAIHKTGVTDNDQSSVHLDAQQNVVKWHYANVPNSHWYISALEEPVIGVSASGYKCTIKLNGEFTEKATDEKVLVTVTKIEDGNEEGAQMSRAANENGSYTFTVADAKANNMTLTTRLDAGNYTIEIPGVMLTTQDGKHTRAISRVFTVNEVGTDIKEISDAAEATGIAYDLQGRRVANPRKGIFIIDGRKVRL